ncbi:hypothetical protein K8I28_06085 [bacterium]|nr:hypothetical protein [bacterium]
MNERPASASQPKFKELIVPLSATRTTSATPTRIRISSTLRSLCWYCGRPTGFPRLSTGETKKKASSFRQDGLPVWHIFVNASEASHSWSVISTLRSTGDELDRDPGRYFNSYSQRAVSWNPGKLSNQFTIAW